MNFTLWTYTVVCNDSKAKLEIDFSRDNGDTWTEVWSRSSGQLYYYYGANNKVYISIPVPVAYQNANFRYRIRGEMASEDCNNFYVFIDDIKIGSPASCSSSYTSARTTSGGGSLEMPELGEAAQQTESLKLERESLADKMKVDFNVAVYPNPSADEFELRLSSMSQNKAVVRVIDALGRVVKTMMLTSNQTVRFGSELKRGNYMVEVVQGDKKEIIKLVKL